MSPYPRFAHCATALIDISADKAFDFLADPLALGTWSLGCMRTRAENPEGPYTGFSQYDDSQVWFDIEAHRELLLIDYLVGRPERLSRRISARVVDARSCALPNGQCYVSLIAWRHGEMSEERWVQMCTAHEAEIWLIKARLERPRLDRQE